MLQSINPCTEELVFETDPYDDKTISQLLEKSVAGFLHNRKLRISESSSKLLDLASILEDEQDRLAKLATEEMGKPIREVRAEVIKCASTARFYANESKFF
jgi:succinate-semialdehyde dehydrogenase/glutarate-semialdehyde dehydrogenase